MPAGVQLSLLHLAGADVRTSVHLEARETLTPCQMCKLSLDSWIACRVSVMRHSRALVDNSHWCDIISQKGPLFMSEQEKRVETHRETT